MPLSRRTKRFLAILAGAFVLLCQTAAAAQACALGAAHASGSALVQPCDDADSHTSDTHGKDAHQSTCPAQHASVNLAKLDFPAAADAPGIAVNASQPVPPARESRVAAKLPARAECLPLTIIHCRLRN